MKNFKTKTIKPPKGLGETLSNARKKKNITIEQAEEETKIRARYLRALESGSYDQLPGSVYSLGFLTKYAEFLGVDKKSLILQFRLEKKEGSQAVSFTREKRMKEPRFSVTPKLLIFLGVTLIISLIFFYIIYNVRAFAMPPNLEISSPSNEQVVKEGKTEIIGKTDEGAILSINDQSVLLDGNGNFSQEVKLNQGLNTFELKSENRLKKQTVKQIKILAEF